jgi:hypothetical protein
LGRGYRNDGEPSIVHAAIVLSCNLGNTSAYVSHCMAGRPAPPMPPSAVSKKTCAGYPPVSVAGRCEASPHGSLRKVACEAIVGHEHQSAGWSVRAASFMLSAPNRLRRVPTVCQPGMSPMGDGVHWIWKAARAKRVIHLTHQVGYLC